MYDFSLLSRIQKGYFKEWFNCFCPYSESQWGPKNMTLDSWGTFNISSSVFAEANGCTGLEQHEGEMW